MSRRILVCALGLSVAQLAHAEPSFQALSLAQYVEAIQRAGDAPAKLGPMRAVTLDGDRVDLDVAWTRWKPSAQARETLQALELRAEVARYRRPASFEPDEIRRRLARLLDRIYPARVRSLGLSADEPVKADPVVWVPATVTSGSGYYYSGTTYGTGGTSGGTTYYGGGSGSGYSSGGSSGGGSGYSSGSGGGGGRGGRVGGRSHGSSGSGGGGGSSGGHSYGGGSTSTTVTPSNRVRSTPPPVRYTPPPVQPRQTTATYTPPQPQHTQPVNPPVQRTLPTRPRQQPPVERTTNPVKVVTSTPTETSVTPPPKPPAVEPPPPPPQPLVKPEEKGGMSWITMILLVLLGALPFVGYMWWRSRQKGEAPPKADAPRSVADLIDPEHVGLDAPALVKIGRKSAQEEDWMRAMRYLFASLLTFLAQHRSVPIRDFHTNREIAGLVGRDRKLAESFWSAATIFELFWFGQRKPMENDFRMFETWANECMSRLPEVQP